jgi:hypothetical protein
MRTRITIALGLALLSLVLATSAALADHPGGGGIKVSSALAGPEGSGTATFTFNRGQEEVCYEVDSDGPTGVFAAHIHRYPVAPGNIVVGTPLDSSGDGSGCVPLLRETIDAILANAGGYYFNVHTPSHPGGAISGDLTR